MKLAKTSVYEPHRDLAGAAGNGHPAFVAGQSPAVQVIERIMADIAPTDIPVLLVGEKGSGKEAAALRIHRMSARREEPFVKVSCGALAPEAFDDWIGGNGHASSGLHSRGSLFLDEISEFHPLCQARLLAAISETNGDIAHSRKTPWSARILCATSQNLEEEMRAGRLREELYYRMNGVTLRLPPLRHRREDIAAFLEFFLDKYAAVLERPRPRLSRESLLILEAHSWPGNIRELENVARLIVALGDETAALAELAQSATPAPNGHNGNGISLKQASRAASRLAERELILKVLTRTRWNRKRAAQELQISYKALLYKLKQIGLDDSPAT
jgi:two-component system response regulator AtoC